MSKAEELFFDEGEGTGNHGYADVGDGFGGGCGDGGGSHGYNGYCGYGDGGGSGGGDYGSDTGYGGGTWKEKG